MTVANPDSSVVHVGNGVSVNFPYSFRIPDPAYVKVSIRDKSTHLVTQVLDNTDYTITGTTWSNYAGGIVTYSPAITTLQEIVIERIVTVDQQLDINNQGGFYADSIEQSFDKLTMIAQEQEADLSRAIVAPVGESVPDLPSLNTADGKVLGYSDGAFVWVANNGAAVAADVLAAQTAATAAELAAAGAAADAVTIQTLYAILPVRFNKLIDTTITASTALVADSDLQIPLAANSVTNIKGEIRYTTTAAGDIKFRHTGPTAPTTLIVERRAVVPGATAYSNIAVDTVSSAADIVLDGGTGTGVFKINAFIANAGNAGTFGISFAQNTSDAGNTVIKAGSYLERAIVSVSLDITFSNNGIAKLGKFVPSSSGGHNFQIATMPTGASYIDFIANGSKAEIQGTSSTSYTVIVDGGAPTVITPASPWEFKTLFSGLSDAAHRVRISGGFYETDIALRISGFAPSVTRPSDIPNYFVLGSAPYSTYGALEGRGPHSTTIYGASPPIMAWPAGCGFGLPFKATTTSIRLWQYNALNPSRLIVMQDGVQIADVTPSNTGTDFEIITLITGLSGSHEYEIKPIQAGRSSYIYGVLVDSIDTVSHTARPLDVTYGDSLASLTGTSAGLNFDARLGAPYLVATAGSHSSILVGYNGQGVSTFLRDNTASATTALPQLPVRAFIWAGAADMRALVAQATFEAAYQAMLTNFRTALSSGQKIYCYGIPDENVATGRLTYNGYIHNAVTAMADANIIYVNTDGWIDPTIGVDTDDGIHPNAAGQAKIAVRQLAAL